jgi:capsular exopolysaccharide synthesis family protein
MDFRTFVRIIAFRWKIAVVAILACMVGAATVTMLQTKGYEASTSILMSFAGSTDVSDVNQATEASQLRMSSYAEIAGSRALAQRAIDQLHAPISADQLVGGTKVTYTPESLLLRLTVKSTNPQAAAALAGAMADQFTALVQQMDPPPPPGPIPAPTAQATVVEAPTVPTEPFRPVPAQNLAQGLLAGVLLGIALALIRHATDRTVRTRETLDRVSGVPMLAALPRYRRAAESGHRADRSLEFEEAVRGLRTRLLALAGPERRSVLMTGPVLDEGATTTALNLALSFTEIGEKAVLVEGDPRRPVIAGSVSVESDAGLADVLAERRTLDDAVHATFRADLWVLASSTAISPEWHFGTAVLARTVEKLCARFDRVVIEGAPALATADASMLAASVDATVLVVRAGKTTVDDVVAAIETLRAAGGNVVGTVLTDAQMSRHLRAANRAYRAKVGRPA